MSNLYGGFHGHVGRVSEIILKEKNRFDHSLVFAILTYNNRSVNVAVYKHCTTLTEHIICLTLSVLMLLESKLVTVWLCVYLCSVGHHTHLWLLAVIFYLLYITLLYRPHILGYILPQFFPRVAWTVISVRPSSVCAPFRKIMMCA